MVYCEHSQQAYKDLFLYAGILIPVFFPVALEDGTVWRIG